MSHCKTKRGILFFTLKFQFPQHTLFFCWTRVHIKMEDNSSLKDEKCEEFSDGALQCKMKEEEMVQGEEVMKETEKLVGGSSGEKCRRTPSTKEDLFDPIKPNDLKKEDFVEKSLNVESEGTSQNYDTNNKYYENMKFAQRHDKYVTTTRTIYLPAGYFKKPSITSTKYGADKGKSEEDYYNMEKRGHIVIFNMQDFSNGHSRKGTQIDAWGLSKLFLDFGFIVERFDNLSTDDVKEVVKSAYYSDFSMCVCAILSHGKDGGIIITRDGEIQLKEISTLYGEKKTLLGKPKCFIIQACRGHNRMKGRSSYSESIDGSLPRDEKCQPTYGELPTEADFLFAYSTVDDHIAFRNSGGSWFIEDFINVYRQNALKMDVVRVLHRVNRKVAERSSKHGKQMPSIVSQLRKDLYFTSKYTNEENFTQ